MKLSSSESSSHLTLVTCDSLSQQTSPYNIKKNTQRQQKYPSQLTPRSSVTANQGACRVGGGSSEAAATGNVDGGH